MTDAQRAAIRNAAERSNESFETLMAKAQCTIGCDGAIALPWCGMWLCIERDGYTHS